MTPIRKKKNDTNVESSVAKFSKPFEAMSLAGKG